jgi:hydrogenase maturation protein HypF
VGYAHALGIKIDDLPFLQNIDKHALRTIREQIIQQPHLPPNSSMGRLFEAVASLIGIRNEVTYDAQAAIEMEVLARPFMAAAKPYPYFVEPTKHGLVARLGELLLSISADVRAKAPIGMIGARFHKTIAELAIDLCKQARSKTDLNEVALSGGVWQNQILLDQVRKGLKDEEFVVYLHRQVPTNDGGLALGQAVIANFQAAKPRVRGEREENYFIH